MINSIKFIVVVALCFFSGALSNENAAADTTIAQDGASVPKEEPVLDMTTIKALPVSSL